MVGLVSFAWISYGACPVHHFNFNHINFLPRFVFALSKYKVSGTEKDSHYDCMLHRPYFGAAVVATAVTITPLAYLFEY